MTTQGWWLVLLKLIEFIYCIIPLGRASSPSSLSWHLVARYFSVPFLPSITASSSAGSFLRGCSNPFAAPLSMRFATGKLCWKMRCGTSTNLPFIILVICHIWMASIFGDSAQPCVCVCFSHPERIFRWRCAPKGFRFFGVREVAHKNKNFRSRKVGPAGKTQRERCDIVCVCVWWRMLTFADKCFIFGRITGGCERGKVCYSGWPFIGNQFILNRWCSRIKPGSFYAEGVDLHYVFVYFLDCLFTEYCVFF